MQAAGLQCLKLQIAAASPDPQTRTFTSTELLPRLFLASSFRNCSSCTVLFKVRLVPARHENNKEARGTWVQTSECKNPVKACWRARCKDVSPFGRKNVAVHITAHIDDAAAHTVRGYKISCAQKALCYGWATLVWLKQQCENARLVPAKMKPASVPRCRQPTRSCRAGEGGAGCISSESRLARRAAGEVKKRRLYRCLRAPAPSLLSSPPFRYVYFATHAAQVAQIRCIVPQVP